LLEGEHVGDDELPSTVPLVEVGESVEQLVAGAAHTCARLSTGNVRCWGAGADGRLGYGNTENIGDNEPPAAAGDVDVGGVVDTLYAGWHHTCARLRDGRLRCWGWGANGRLGNASTHSVGDDDTPAMAGNVELGGQLVSFAAGGAHSCASLTIGEVRCWGAGASGQLGHADTADMGPDEPPAVMGAVDVGAAVAELTAGEAHTCARHHDGSVRCWGSGEHGRLGYGDTETVGDDETPQSAGTVAFD
jgi:alpha-tubulin suppressor-like RCC1 family protein